MDSSLSDPHYTESKIEFGIEISWEDTTSIYQMLQVRLLQKDLAGDHATREDRVLVGVEDHLKHGELKAQDGMTTEHDWETGD